MLSLTQIRPTKKKKLFVDLGQKFGSSKRARGKNFRGVFFDVFHQSEQDSEKKNSKILPMRQTKAEIQTCWLCLSATVAQWGARVLLRPRNIQKGPEKQKLVQQHLPLVFVASAEAYRAKYIYCKILSNT